MIIFSANGEYLVSGDEEAVRVWRVAGGMEVGSMGACDVRSIAISKDGRFIAGGTELGIVTVWDSDTRETIFTHKEDSRTVTKVVDFSPDSDSTQLVIIASSNCHTVTVWDLASQKQILGLPHDQLAVVAAKYSPQGDRIATACTNPGSIRVYDSRSGELFVNILTNVAAHPSHNSGLTWSSDGQYLFVIADSKIKQIRVSTGTAATEWPIHDHQSYTCIAPSKYGEFIAYSSSRTVNVLDTLTGKLSQVIKHDQDIDSIALSPDGRFLASATENGKISVRSLRDVPTLSSLSVSSCVFWGYIIPEIAFLSIHLAVATPACLNHTSHWQGPFIHVGGPVLDLWKQGELVKAEALLSKDIDSQDPSYRTLAHRALIRSRLRDWDAANDDAQKVVFTLYGLTPILIYTQVH